ncbi:MAG TPA: hypothetical protein VJR27_04025 [Candidatus Saccharimonadales bacterium]|nr:hypothetical protein [Candidatus Saccharimonadales bacterium]
MAQSFESTSLPSESWRRVATGLGVFMLAGAVAGAAVFAEESKAQSHITADISADNLNKIQASARASVKAGITWLESNTKSCHPDAALGVACLSTASPAELYHNESSKYGDDGSTEMISFSATTNQQGSQLDFKYYHGSYADKTRNGSMGGEVIMQSPESVFEETLTADRARQLVESASLVSVALDDPKQYGKSLTAQLTGNHVTAAWENANYWVQNDLTPQTAADVPDFVMEQLGQVQQVADPLGAGR